jgi:3-methyladenine DNA glycosylase AlkD
VESDNERAVLSALHADVAALATPERAKANTWYFKTGPGEYGEGDQFAGLTLPQVRSLVKKYRDLSIEDCEELLHSPLHEERLLAVLLWVQRCRARKTDAATRERIYNLYLANSAYVNNWDLVDASATYIVGPYLQDKPRDVLLRLAASDLVWDRRIAVLATFHFIKQGDCTDALQVAEALMGDKHDLIHKAVGWMLREVEKKCGHATLTTFLDRFAVTMPRTALRYALERFAPEERAHYMSMKQRSRSKS